MSDEDMAVLDYPRNQIADLVKEIVDLTP